MFERGATRQSATQAMAALIAANKGKFGWLEPPASIGALTVVDAVAARSDADLDRLVAEWARSAWEAWSRTTRRCAGSIPPVSWPGSRPAGGRG